MSPIASNATAINPPCIVADGEVSWPTIVWALLPIMFNSMTQPAGSIARGITAEQSFYLRASPIVCILEALTVFIQFAHLSFKTQNPRWAIKQVSNDKYQGSNDAESPRTQLQSLQENDVFRAILFVCGVLPQTLKLYAYTEIPMSKLLLSVYLTSWTTLELLVIVPSKYRDYETLEEHNLEQGGIIALTDRILALACYYLVRLSDIMALYVLLSELYQLQMALQPPPKAADTCFWLAMDFYTGTLSVSAHLLPPHDGDFWALALLEPLVCGFWLLLLTQAGRAHEPAFGRAEVIWLLSLRLGHYISTTGLSKLDIPRALSGTYRLNTPRSPFVRYTRTGSIAFFFMQVLTGLGYYSLRCDLGGTGKPAWAGYLG